MDVQTAISVVDHLGGGGVVFIGGLGVETAACGLLEGGGHALGNGLHLHQFFVAFVKGLVAPGVQHALNAGVQGGQRVDVFFDQEILHSLNFGFACGSGAGVGKGVGSDNAAFAADGFDVKTVPLVVEGAVHVDAAVAGIVRQDAVLVPVGALAADVVLLVALVAVQRIDGRSILQPADIIIGSAGEQIGDIAIAVDVGIGIRERHAVAVEVARTQVLTGVDHEGLLVAVGIDDGYHVDHITVQQVGYVGILGVERQPPHEVHGAGGAFAFAAVDVGKNADAGFVFVGHGFVGQLHAPQCAFLPGTANLVHFADFGAAVSDGLHLLFQFVKSVAGIPVDIQVFGNAGRCAGGGGKGCQRQKGDDQGQHQTCKTFHMRCPPCGNDLAC